MQELAQKDKHLPDVRAIAEFCGDPLGLDAYLRGHWVYVKDPDWAEYVRSPGYQLDMGKDAGYFMGDCDDAATFAGCIALSLGWPSRLTAYRMPNNPEFSHVNMRVLLSDGTLFDVDPTVPASQLPVKFEEVLEVRL